MTLEEKERRKKEREQIKYDKTHKIINGLIFKWCTYDEHWIEMNDENFYKNKSNHIDGFNTYCKKCTSRKSDKWQDENHEHHLVMLNKWYRAHESVWVKQSRKRRLNGKHQKWQRNNPEKLKQYALNREHKKHTISKKEWISCQKYFNNSCAYCGLPIEEHFTTYRGITKQGNFHKEHVDHEGANDLSNCIPSCKSCNCEKHTYSLEEWYNEDNIKYSEDRINKIHKWLDGDYELFINKK